LYDGCCARDLGHKFTPARPRGAPRLQVQVLATAFVEAWARCGPGPRAALAGAGLNPALAAAAMAAAACGDEDGGSGNDGGGGGGGGADGGGGGGGGGRAEGGGGGCCGVRDLRMRLCQAVRLMEFDAASTTDADRAGWARPVLYIAADAAAAGDLELADAAMRTLVHAARVGGPLVAAALRELHLLPTLEALAAAPDARLRARAVAALPPLLGAGLVASEAERAAWRDRLLGWLAEGDDLEALSAAAGGGSGSLDSPDGDGRAAPGDEEESVAGSTSFGAIARWWRGARRRRRGAGVRPDPDAAALRKACVGGLEGAAWPCSTGAWGPCTCLQRAGRQGWSAWTRRPAPTLVGRSCPCL
jgi:hypothetical protein